uniref:Uncharacterized protein n=1 Tax=Anopheles coluzzii TaxID=1518534 RepID=A0A8W7PR78_ANOCL
MSSVVGVSFSLIGCPSKRKRTTCIDRPCGWEQGNENSREENFRNDIFGSRQTRPADRGAAGCSLAPDCPATLRLSVVLIIGGIVATRAAGSRPPSTAAAAMW